MTKFVPGGPSRYKHQRRGLRRMIETGGNHALLFEPGTGKTAVTLDYSAILALKSPEEEIRVLVVCPLVAVDTWVSQAATFMSPQVNYWAEALGGTMLERAEALASRGGQPYRRPLPGKRRRSRRAAERAQWHERSLAWGARTDGRPEDAAAISQSEGPDAVPNVDKPRVVIEVLNLDTFSQRQAVGSKTMADVMLDAVRRYDPHLVVADELHKIKGASSNASRLMARVAKDVPRRVGLTGTVMPHSPLDVFAQWRFIAPYAFGDSQPDGSKKIATFGGFRNRYAIFGGWMGKEVTGFKNLDEMQKIMSQNATVAKKSEALDLPPTTDTILPVHLSPSETKAYNDMKSSLATQLDNGNLASVTSRLTQMLRMRQITSGHLPDDDGESTVIGQSKAQTIRSLVNDSLIGEKRVVVFALFTAEIDLLCRVLAEKGTEVQKITGGTSTEERLRLRQRFGSDDPQRMIMVAQVKTMSLAVNELVTASHAVFASQSQQRDDMVQARDRLNRIGQTRNVTFHYALAPGTVDEVIHDTHRKRGDLETAMLKHVRGED